MSGRGLFDDPPGMETRSTTSQGQELRS